MELLPDPVRLRQRFREALKAAMNAGDGIAVDTELIAQLVDRPTG